MILDTSAIIAILRNETEAPVFAKAVEGAVHRRISAVNYAEAAAVIDGSRARVTKLRERHSGVGVRPAGSGGRSG